MKIIAVLVIMLSSPLTAWGVDYNTAHDATEKGENIFYGAGAFLQHKIIPQIFTKAKFIYYSFERATNFLPSGYTTKRYDASMILPGTGYIHQVNSDLSVFAELSFDILQDSNSPFELCRL